MSLLTHKSCLLVAPSWGAGPHLLDLGDVLYAPNCFQDGQGRTIMLAWLQELRQGGGFDYAGCLSLPRVLSYKSRAPAPLTLVILLHKLG